MDRFRRSLQVSITRSTGLSFANARDGVEAAGETAVVPIRSHHVPKNNVGVSAVSTGGSCAKFLQAYVLRIPWAVFIRIDLQRGSSLLHWRSIAIANREGVVADPKPARLPCPFSAARRRHIEGGRSPLRLGPSQTTPSGLVDPVPALRHDAFISPRPGVHVGLAPVAPRCGVQQRRES